MQSVLVKIVPHKQHKQNDIGAGGFLGWRALLSCASGALYDWACAVDDVYFY